MASNRSVLLGLALASILFSLYSEGCVKKTVSLYGEPTRYQTIEIPGYQKGDYETLLDSNNDEVRYNAICNLIRYAVDYGRLLSKGPAEGSEQEKPTEDAQAVKNAKHVYEKIVAQLNGANERIKAVALIFLSEFGSVYAGKPEIFNLVLKTETNDIHTQYEQLNALIGLLEPESEIAPARITKFLNSRSWMIRSKTYLLLSRIDSDEFHERLIKEYRSAANNVDKILIINAFRNGFGPDVFNLLTHELQHGQNLQLKYACAGAIKNNRDAAAVIQWIVTNSSAIPDDMLFTIINSYFSELCTKRGQIFFRTLLSSNQEKLTHAVNQEDFFSSLYNALRIQGNSVELSEIEAAVNDSEILRNPWLVYKNKRDEEGLKQAAKAKREASFEKHILPKYNNMLEEFIIETEKLFIEGGMDQQEVEETTKDLREFLRLLKNDGNK